MRYKRNIEDVTVTESAVKFPLKDKTVTIPFEDVIGCDVVLPKNEESDRFCCGGRRHIATVTALQGYIQISYINRSTKEPLLLEKNELQVTAIPETCYQIQRDIHSYLEQAGDRPRKLLVLINPISGKKNAVKQYQKVMAPLFEAAKVKTDVTYTTHSKHMAEVVTSYNLDTVDGIVILGGDGSICEVLNALIRKSQCATGEPITDMQPVKTPIAVIPLGSANGLAMDLYGVSDIQTATLHVIKGSRRTRSLLGVYTGGEFMSCSCALVSTGLFADMMYYAEKRRKLGTSRYFLIAFWLLLFKAHKEYESTVTYFTSKDEEEDGTTVQEVSQQELKGRFIAFTNFTGNIMDLKAGKQWATVQEKMADNNPPVTNLLAYRDARGFHIMKHMVEMQKRKEESLKKDFLEILNTTSYKVRFEPPPPDEQQSKKYQVDGNKTESDEEEYNGYSYISVDGEIYPIKDHQFEVRHYPQAVTYFSSV